MKKFKIKKLDLNKKISLTFSLIILLLFILLSIAYLNSEANKLITLAMTAISIIVTAYFSALIYFSSQESYDLSKLIASREDSKESEKIRESALIVYYDLYLGLNGVRNIYISQCTYNYNNTPEEMFFSNEWIKNVAILKAELENKEDSSDNIDYIQEIYFLYGELLTIKDYLEKVKTNEKAYKPLLEHSIRQLTQKFMTYDYEELEKVHNYFHYTGMLYEGDKTYEEYKKGLITTLKNEPELEKAFKEYPLYKDLRSKWIIQKAYKLDINIQHISEKYKKILIKLDAIASKKEE